MHTHAKSRVIRERKRWRSGVRFGWVVSNRHAGRIGKSDEYACAQVMGYLRLGCSTVLSDPVVRFDSRAV